MTISELKDYISKYTGEGKGNAIVLICDMRDNPLTNGTPVKDAVFLEWKDGGCMFILQTS